MATCTNSACVCPEGTTECMDMGMGFPGGGPTTVCDDLQTSARNCGTCGNECAMGEVCNQGTCSAGCSEGLANCPGMGMGGAGSCVNLTNDKDNCGLCGTRCGTNEDCTNSQCVCAAGYTACSGECVDLNTSATNCGSCNNACPNGEICGAGDGGQPTCM
jgi:hypothetical protein